MEPDRAQVIESAAFDHAGADVCERRLPARRDAGQGAPGAVETAVLVFTAGHRRLLGLDLKAEAALR